MWCVVRGADGSHRVPGVEEVAIPEAPPFRKERQCGKLAPGSEFCFTEVPGGSDGFN